MKNRKISYKEETVMNTMTKTKDAYMWIFLVGAAVAVSLLAHFAVIF